MRLIFVFMMNLMVSSFFLLSACTCPHHAKESATIFKSKDKTIEIIDPIYNILNGADNGAAYCTIKNSSDKKDKLKNAYFLSDGVKTVELHTHVLDENGVAKMRKVEALEVEGKDGRGEKKLEPGHDHIMLIGVDPKLHKKTKIKLLLEFENAGKIEVTFHKTNVHSSCCSKK